jgi:HK97 family phage portal protein
MGLKSFFKGRPAPETRAQVVAVDASAASTVQEIFGLVGAGDRVTFDQAIGVPAIWAAVGFLSGAMAALPLKVKHREAGIETEVDGALSDLMGRAANDEVTAFQFRKSFFQDVLGSGRGYAFIERDARGDPINLYNLDYSGVTVRRTVARGLVYDYTRANGSTITYPASDIIDVSFMLKGDHLSSYNPIATCAAAILQSINASRYASTVFGKNGIPPYLLKGPFASADVAQRAAADVAKAAMRQAAEGRPILPMPVGHDLVRLGDDPEKMQLTEVQRFCVEQAARIWGIPPVFLQDLSKGTFSNNEQQDLHFVKHTLSRWVVQSEQEMSLKLFGRSGKLAGRSGRLNVKFNLDGTLRGDFRTRMDGLSTAVQNGLKTPNEARGLLGDAPLAGGEGLMIQSATVPISLLNERLASENARLAAEIAALNLKGSENGK